MQYIFRANKGDLTDARSNVVDVLYDRDRGAINCTIMQVYTPPGGGSPEGLHTHEVDQIFYIIEGQMNIEVDGRKLTADPGSLVVFPAGVPHRNWNVGGAPTRHLSIAVPMPPSGKPFAIRVTDSNTL